MQKSRILVVDDDKDILDLVSLILNIHGFEPIPFTSGYGFIEKVMEVKPKIILLDVQLGDFDGRILCKQIKEIKEHSGIPVILFSANVLYAKNVQEYLCDDFIEKPFDVLSLIEMLNKYIDRLN